MNDTGFACTTINPLAQALVHNIDAWRVDKLGPISLALDRKSGDPAELPDDVDLILHDAVPQSVYERLCPWDSYSRKNTSFARLARTGAEYIFETDDDNFFNTGNLLSRICQARSFFDCVSTLNPATRSNVFELIYDVPNNVWARGYPVPWLEQRSETSTDCDACIAAGVIQFLVDGNPDVDAIYRLIFGNRININTENFNTPIYAFRNIHPFNSQATLWPRKYYALMYLPSSCDFRMTDIWRGYIAQHVMYAHGHAVVYAPALVRQQRNEHLIYKDFFGEYGGYRQVLTLLNLLNDIEIDISHTAEESLYEIYSVLVENGFFEPRELVLLGAYLESLH